MPEENILKKEKTSPETAESRQVICDKCKESVDAAALIGNWYICPVCGKYNRVPARIRIRWLTDAGSFTEHLADLSSGNPIGFPGYEEKVQASMRKSGEKEGVLTGEAKIGGFPVCLFVMDANFMMGSMGTVVGDKIASLFEFATARRLPVIGYTLSGGARMQEGILSLMQMAKVSGAVKMHSDAGLFYLVAATDPTTGGVTASFAMLGDIIISEPGALIGFAGKRVVEQVTGQKMPPEFQSAEFQLKNGFVDAIVPRQAQREYLIHMLRLHAGK